MAVFVDGGGFAVNSRHGSPARSTNRLGVRVSWLVIGSSAVGSSHRQSNGVCQDSCFYHVADHASGAGYLVALAADGAGSAEFSEIGAEIACEIGGNVLISAIEESGETAFVPALATKVLDTIRSKIEETALERSVTSRELACTLVAAAVGPTYAIYFQIGDGAAVARHDGVLSPIFWPEAGEYANMTYFVTDANASEHLRCDIRASTDELALFTDGLQRLALVFSSETAHEPFFDPMFKILRTSSDEHTDQLCVALGKFLQSDAINERTDDDKTLILATRKPGG